MKNIRLTISISLLAVLAFSCAPVSNDTSTKQISFSSANVQPMDISQLTGTKLEASLRNPNTCSENFNTGADIYMQAGSNANILGNAYMSCDASGNCTKSGFSTTGFGLEAPGTLTTNYANILCESAGRALGVLVGEGSNDLYANQVGLVKITSGLSASLRGKKFNIGSGYAIKVESKNKKTGLSGTKSFFFTEEGVPFGFNGVVEQIWNGTNSANHRPQQEVQMYPASMTQATSNQPVHQPNIRGWNY